MTSRMPQGRDVMLVEIRISADEVFDMLSTQFFAVRRLDVEEGAAADDAAVSERWAELLRTVKPFAEQGSDYAKLLCGYIYSTNDRSVAQDWTIAANYWKDSALAGNYAAQWCISTCYYFGRGVDRDEALGQRWMKKAAEGGHCRAPMYLTGGERNIHSFKEEFIDPFTSADSDLARRLIANRVADVIQGRLHSLPRVPDGVSVPNMFPRESTWVDFMIDSAISEDDLEKVKEIYAYAVARWPVNFFADVGVSLHNFLSRCFDE